MARMIIDSLQRFLPGNGRLRTRPAARALPDPADMTGKQLAGQVHLPSPQCRENGAMIVIGARLPIGAPGGEQETGAGVMQIVDRRDQSRHLARCQDHAVKGTVRDLPLPHVPGMFGGMCGIFSSGKQYRRDSGSGMSQRQGFQRRAHFRDFAQLRHIEGGDTVSPTGLTRGKPLRLKLPERLAHRDMAGTELRGNMILPEPGIGRDDASNDPFGKCGRNAGGDGFARLTGHIIDKYGFTRKIKAQGRVSLIPLVTELADRQRVSRSSVVKAALPGAMPEGIWLARSMPVCQPPACWRRCSGRC